VSVLVVAVRHGDRARRRGGVHHGLHPIEVVVRILRHPAPVCHLAPVARRVVRVAHVTRPVRVVHAHQSAEVVVAVLGRTLHGIRAGDHLAVRVVAIQRRVGHLGRFYQRHGRAAVKAVEGVGPLVAVGVDQFGAVAGSVVLVLRELVLGVGDGQQPPQGVVVVHRGVAFGVGHHAGVVGRGVGEHRAVPQRVGYGQWPVRVIVRRGRGQTRFRVGHARDSTRRVVAVGRDRPLTVAYRLEAARGVVGIHLGNLHTRHGLRHPGAVAQRIVAVQDRVGEGVSRADDATGAVVRPPRRAPQFVREGSEVAHLIVPAHHQSFERVRRRHHPAGRVMVVLGPVPEAVPLLP
jgi:hypothetical protein